MNNAEKQYNNTVTDAAQTETARAEMLHGWYIDSCEYYADSFRRTPTVSIRRDIAFIIRDGMTAECLKAIMDESQRAAAPSWNYCMAIIRRCKRDGIMTLADWHRDRQRREAEQNSALRFNERAYQDSDFGPEFFVNMNPTPARGRAANSGGNGLVPLPWDEGAGLV